MQFDEQTGDARGASRRKLPVGVEFGIVNRDVVGVALDAHIVGRAAQGVCDLAQ